MNHRRSGKCIAICAALEGGRLRAKAAHPRRWSFQMEVPRLLALDASKGAIRNFLLCQAISDDVNRELAAPIYKHCNTLDRLAPGHSRSSRRQSCVKSSRVIPSCTSEIP